jgi:AcrR family transcriptional regulator
VTTGRVSHEGAPSDATTDLVSSDPASTGNRGPYRKGVRRRKEIVQAASEVFAEFGYSGGSIRTIADRVGVSPATLIQYFGSKHQLLAAVLQDWNDRRDDRVPAGSLRGLAYFDSLRDLMRFHVSHRGLVELFLTMTAEASSPTHPARTFIQDRYATSVADCCRHLGEAVGDHEISSLTPIETEREVRTLFAVMDGLELQWLLDPATDMVDMFDHYLDSTIERWRSGPRRAFSPTENLAPTSSESI